MRRQGSACAEAGQRTRAEGKAAGGVRRGPAQVQVGVQDVGRALGERGSWGVSCWFSSVGMEQEKSTC